jgi:hypothetical protein
VRHGPKGADNEGTAELTELGVKRWHDGAKTAW